MQVNPATPKSQQSMNRVYIACDLAMCSKFVTVISDLFPVLERDKSARWLW